VDAIIS
jgi:flagella basal body P-ring formation protein FlgA